MADDIFLRLTTHFQRLCVFHKSEKDSKEEILKAFRLFDDDCTGKISFKNLKRVAKELGENLTDEELQVGLDTSTANAGKSTETWGESVCLLRN